MTTSTATRAATGAAQPVWASVTASLILPFDLRLALPGELPPAEQAPGWTTERWTLRGLQDRSSYFLSTKASNLKNRAQWFSSARFQEALQEVRYAHLPADHATNAKLSDAGIVVKCVERRMYDDVGLLVLHMTLQGEALEHPESAFHALRRPYSALPTPGLPETFPDQVREGLEEILRLSGLRRPRDVDAERLGISKGGFVALLNERDLAIGRDGERRAFLRPFLVAHLAPEAELQTRSPMTERLSEWEPAEAWAFAVSSGIGAGRSLVLAPDTSEAARHQTGWLARTLVRASEHGLAFVATGPADSRSSEDSGIEALTHGPVIDLAVLAMRQRMYLMSHAEQLAEVAAGWAQVSPAQRVPDADQVLDSAGDVLRTALVLDAAFVQFRNTTWFTSVPNRVEGTSLLRLLQAGLGTDELITEIVEKQADLTRVLDLVTTIREREEQERRFSEAKLRESREREEQERRSTEAELREKLNLRIGIGAAILAPSALVFGAAALAADPTARLFWWSLGGAFGLSAISSLVVYLLHRRDRRNRRRPPGRPTSRSES